MQANGLCKYNLSHTGQDAEATAVCLADQRLMPTRPLLLLQERGKGEEPQRIAPGLTALTSTLSQGEEWID